MKPSISVVIIAKNEADMIQKCLDTVKWCDEVIVINSGSTDKTIQIAETAGAKIINFEHSSFSKLRDEGAKRSKSDWIFYLDADERVTPTLAKEIQVMVETNQYPVLALKRQNYFYGRLFEHGGWQSDILPRVFKSDILEGWRGDVHETPIFKGEVGELHTPLIHLSHRNTTDGLTKTISWTKIEARMLFESGLAPVTPVLIFRKGIMEFWRRGFKFKGYRDGREGLIEAIVQAINKMLIYIQVWEFQQKPSLSQKYVAKELEVANLWRTEEKVI